MVGPKLQELRPASSHTAWLRRQKGAAAYLVLNEGRYRASECGYAIHRCILGIADVGQRSDLSADSCDLEAMQQLIGGISLVDIDYDICESALKIDAE